MISLFNVKFEKLGKQRTRITNKWCNELLTITQSIKMFHGRKVTLNAFDC